MPSTQRPRFISRMGKLRASTVRGPRFDHSLPTYNWHILHMIHQDIKWVSDRSVFQLPHFNYTHQNPQCMEKFRFRHSFSGYTIIIKLGKHACQWLTLGSTHLCRRRSMMRYCSIHMGRLRKGDGTKPCIKCGKRVKHYLSSLQQEEGHIEEKRNMLKGFFMLSFSNWVTVHD